VLSPPPSSRLLPRSAASSPRGAGGAAQDDAAISREVERVMARLVDNVILSLAGI
jgi:hypothetical protein